MGSVLDEQVSMDHLQIQISPDISLSDEIAIPRRTFSIEDGCELWEISTPRKNDLVWSICLSFLSDPERDIPSNIRQITDIEKVQTRVGKCNPFVDKCSYFNDGEINDFVSRFYDHIQPKINRDVYGTSENFQGSRLDLPTRQRLEHMWTTKAASSALDCIIKICVQEHGQSSLKLAFTYPDNFDELNEDLSFVTVIQKVDNGSKTPRFSFGLSRNSARDLQKQAFAAIFSETELHSEADKVPFPGAERNLLISLLKKYNRFKPFVKKLYSQPPYIFHRLKDAGFVTDPRKTEYEGNENEFSKTAFYYSSQTADFDLLFQMYDFSCSTPQWLPVAERTMNSDLLTELSSVLDNTQMQIECLLDDPETKRISLCYLQQLKSIHNFQTELHTKLQAVFNSECQCNELQGTRSQEGCEICDVNKRKNAVLTIISVYEQFSDGKELTDYDPNSTDYGLFKKYSKYFYYFNFLSILKFFDHCFALKEKLLLTGDQYEKIESAFCRLFFFSYCLEKRDAKESCVEGLDISDDAESIVESPKSLDFHILCHLNEQAFKEELQKFSDFLKNVNVEADSITPSLPTRELDVLKSQPEIKDEFLLSRLKHHMDLAMELNFERDTEVSILIMKRTLQVLGESLAASDKIETTLVKALLVSIIQPKIMKHLYAIRCDLSHYEENSIWAQHEDEQDKHIMSEVQKELKNLKNDLQLVEAVQVYRIRMWVLSRRITLLRQKLEETKISKKSKEDPFSVVPESYPRVIRDDITTAENEIDMLRSNFLTATRSLSEKYEIHFQNLRSQVTSCCDKKVFKPEKNIKILNTSLDCYKIILEFLLFHFSSLPESYEDYNAKGCKKFYNELTEEKVYLSETHNESTPEEVITEAIEKLQKLEKRKQTAFAMMGFKKIISEDDKTPKINEQLRYPNIEMLSRGLKRCLVGEKEVILSYVDESYKKQHNALNNLMDFVMASGSVNANGEEFVNSELEKLVYVTPKMKKHLKHMCLKCPPETAKKELKNKVKDQYGSLSNVLDKGYLDIKTFTTFCEIFEFPEEVKDILRKITKCSPEEGALLFLKQRVFQLKSILEQLGYKKPAHKAQESKESEFNRHIVLLNYQKSPSARAATEFLFFDCAELLKSRRKDLKRVWIKTNRLFSGINLRHVLAHGNPLLDAVTLCVDAWDLNNEIISKVLELVEDYDTIEALCNLHSEKRGEFASFVETIVNEEFQARITDCPRWRDYVSLVSGTSK